MAAGILLVVLPSVMYGGLSLLMFLTQGAPGFVDNPLRHDLWRAGHAHAGVYLVLSLVMLRYVDEALLPPFWKWIARTGAPMEPNGLLSLAYIGALFLAAAVLSLGIGLIRAARCMAR
jgi:drug/metabolite transporter superfamily protein YnfA